MQTIVEHIVRVDKYFIYHFELIQILPILIITLIVAGNIGVFGLLVLMLVVFMIDNYAAASPVPESANSSITKIKDFNFVTVGDWGCNSDTINVVKNILDKNPELVLGLGDYSYQTSADCWLKLVDPIDEKMKIAIGDHEHIIHKPHSEYHSPYLLNQYMSHFNLTKQYYSFDYHNIHFIVMSAEVPFGRGSEQYNFVNNDLAAASSSSNSTTTDWIVVILHEPMYTSPTGKFNGTDSRLIERYHPLFDKYKVDLVLSGDIHNYQRSYPLKYNSSSSSKPTITLAEKNDYIHPIGGGEIYVTVGTGGAPLHKSLKQQSSYIAAQQATAKGILNMDILNNGQVLVGTFFANNGTIRDQFIIDKRNNGSKGDSVINATSSADNQDDNTTTASPLTTTYENHNIGIKIEYSPIHWQQLEQGISELYPVFFSLSEKSNSAAIFERLHIFVYTSDNRSLNNIVSEEINNFKKKSITNFYISELNKNSTLLAGMPAYRLEYSGREGEYDFKALELWTIKGDNVYNLLYIASVTQYITHLQTIQQMINSFEIIT